MILFAMAALGSGAPAHIIDGAFGFQLGQADKPALETCEDEGISSGPTGSGERMFVCKGDQFFSRIYVHSKRGLITSISASRTYRPRDIAEPEKQCGADLASLITVIDKRYPTLLQATVPTTKWSVERTEKLLGRLSYGRSIKIRCAELFAPAGPKNTLGYTLWLTYSISVEEGTALRDAEDADQLKAKGLNPENL